MEQQYLKKREILSFGFAGFGRNMIYTIMSMFLLMFYTDAAKLDPIDAGTLILVARIFDAANDPLMGMIVDKTHTRWGKMRPYLLWSPILIAIATALLFYSPDVSYTGRLIYAYVTYIAWGIAFTVQDVPFWGMSSVITPLEGERTKFLSVARVFCTVGGILPTLLVPMLRQSLGLESGYFISGLVFALVGSGLSLLAFFGTKERVEPVQSSVSMKESVRIFLKNKPLLLVIMAAILGSTMVMAQTAGSYIGTYLLTDSGIIPKNVLLTVMTVCIGIGMLPAMLLLPALRKKFSLKAIYIGSSLFGAAVHLLLYFIGYSNIYLLLFCFILIGVPLGIYNVITYALVADSVDFVEFKTGKRAEGVCFASQTFISKVTAGIATFVTSIVLKVVHFQQPVADAAGVLQPVLNQSRETTNGLFFMITLLPAAGFLLTCIPMFFHDYTGKKKEAIQQELMRRREAEGSPSPESSETVNR